MREVWTLLALVAVFAGVSGCGGSSQQEQQAAQARREKARQLKEAKAQAAKAQAAADSCHQAGDGLLRHAKALDSRLDVGLNYDSYSSQVADLKVAYDDADFKKLSTGALDCLSGVGVPLEKAVNRYIEAYRIWNKCFESLECSNDQITGKLQSKWAEADAAVRRAERSLEGLDRAAQKAKNRAEAAS